MEIYATEAEYHAMYPDDQVDDNRLALQLESASVKLRMEFRRRGIEIDTEDEDFMHDLKDTCMAMVHRANLTMDQGPYTQMTETAGPYTQSVTLANPNGDMYLTSNEKKRLGLTKGSIYSMRAQIEGADDTW